MSYNELAEMNVIGALLTETCPVRDVESILKPEYFWVPLLSEIYREIVRQVHEARALSAYKVIETVAAHPRLVELGRDGLNEYVQRIMEQAGTATLTSCVGNAHYISSLYKTRLLDAKARELTQAIAAGNQAMIADVKKQIEEVNLAPVTTNTMTMEDQIRQAYNTLQKPNQLIQTGIRQWDDTFGGLSRKARYIIAAYGGAGKTALAAQIATNVAKQGHKVRYMLFEETAEKIWARVVANRMRCSMRELRNKRGLTEKGHKAFSAFFDEMQGTDLMFLENPQTVQEMIDLCEGCGLIVVDGVSMFPSPPEFTKIDKAGWVSDQCAKLSQMTGASVLMLSHVNNDALKSGPSLAGIYGGQAASFDPEGILEIRRAVDEEVGPMRVVQGLVLKNRYGEVGVRMNFRFEGEYMTYWE